jgi:hypothetical protein
MILNVILVLSKHYRRITCVFVWTATGENVPTHALYLHCWTLPYEGCRTDSLPDNGQCFIFMRVLCCARRSWLLRSLIRGSEVARLLRLWVRIASGLGCLSFGTIMCWQIQVSASSRCFVQRSLTQCGVCECDHDASIMKWPWPNRVCWAIKIDDDWLTYKFIACM